MRRPISTALATMLALGLAWAATPEASATTAGLPTTGSASSKPAPPCNSYIDAPCYTPTQLYAAYGLNKPFAQGIDGRGRTIVLVDPFGSPTIQHDRDTFDAQFGIPNTRVQVIKYGDVPPFNPNDPDMVGWAGEASLDVESAHAFAPGAHIVLLETSVSETYGTVGFPQIMSGIKSLVDRGVGDVISLSLSSPEPDFPGFAQGNYSSPLNLRYGLEAATAHGVTVVSGSGDAGPAGYESDNTTVIPYQNVSWPGSDPLVTSVAPLQLNLNAQGQRVAPDTVWNDAAGAAGGGESAIFPRPAYQDGVANIVGDHRAIPDIGIAGSYEGAMDIYATYSGAGSGWSVGGGSSQAAPLFADIVALADQVAGHRLGNINPAIYKLGALSQTPGNQLPTGLEDVTTGDSSHLGFPGFQAGPGYDLASGWGDINAPAFVTALARPA
jgi:subtilase family serine protease